MQLLNGATAIAVLAGNHNDFTLLLDGTTALVVKAVANATAAVVYAATIVATPVPTF
jgi:hypothetical protein